jgi:hypothetical protein
MPLTSPSKWTCDSCGEPIAGPRFGTLEFRWQSGGRTDFRIVHNGNVDGGRCQTTPANGDVPLDDLAGDRCVDRMLALQSSDPTWAECFRRLAVPLYEEARPFLDQAARDGWEPIPGKLSAEKLKAIIVAHTE